jgi:hypothetical protein
MANNPRLTVHVVLWWNGTLCLDGHATATTAWDIIRGHLEGNFAGVEHGVWMRHHFPTLSQFGDELERGEVKVHFSDPTGTAIAQAEKV